MAFLFSLVATLFSLTSATHVVKTQSEFFALYNEVFPHGNRNAASHRWANYVLEEAEELTVEEIRFLFGSFCPVSGSPIDANRDASWEMTLQDLSGEDHNGFVNFCCEPCVCDTKDLIRVDPTEIQTAEGPHTFDFLVIGDPCVDPAKIPVRDTPDVTCENPDGSLDHASTSASGKIIIGMLQPLDKPATPESEANEYCEQRAAVGFQGGMGQIFRAVAQIQPLEVTLGSPQCSAGAAQAEYDALLQATQTHAVVLAGAVIQSQHYRCFVDAQQKLDQHKVCFHSVDISNDLWTYLKCLYPDEKTNGMLMHSYLYIGGDMVGNGFVVDPQMDSRYTWSELEQKMHAAGASFTCGVDCTSLIDPEELTKLNSVVAAQPVVLFGWEPCPCVATARDRFRSRHVCFVENTWTDMKDQKMKYLQCMYGAEHHSFIWFNTKNGDSMEGGEFIGDGFALGPTVMSDERFSTLLTRSGASLQCQGKEDKNLLGGDLQSCSDLDDVKTTGVTRTGSCVWQPHDTGYHQVCVQMTDYFIQQSAKLDKNDLSGVVGQGGHWCICAWAWASAVQRDPASYEGIHLECDRTNERLRNVYQTYIDSDDEICGPGGRCYEAKQALDAVNKLCPQTADEGDGPLALTESMPASAESARADEQSETMSKVVPEVTDTNSFAVLAGVVLVGSVVFGVSSWCTPKQTIEAIPLDDDLENLYDFEDHEKSNSGPKPYYDNTLKSA